MRKNAGTFSSAVYLLGSTNHHHNTHLRFICRLPFPTILYFTPARSFNDLFFFTCGGKDVLYCLFVWIARRHDTHGARKRGSETKLYRIAWCFVTLLYLFFPSSKANKLRGESETSLFCFFHENKNTTTHQPPPTFTKRTFLITKNNKHTFHRRSSAGWAATGDSRSFFTPLSSRIADLDKRWALLLLFGQ